MIHPNDCQSFDDHFPQEPPLSVSSAKASIHVHCSVEVSPSRLRSRPDFTVASTSNCSSIGPKSPVLRLRRFVATGTVAPAADSPPPCWKCIESIRKKRAHDYNLDLFKMRIKPSAAVQWTRHGNSDFQPSQRLHRHFGELSYLAG